jgi:hypothetical protein
VQLRRPISYKLYPKYRYIESLSASASASAGASTFLAQLRRPITYNPSVGMESASANAGASNSTQYLSLPAQLRKDDDVPGSLRVIYTRRILFLYSSTLLLVPHAAFLARLRTALTLCDTL